MFYKCSKYIITNCITFFPEEKALFKFHVFMSFVCLFDLMLSVPVNSNGHVGTLPPFNGTYIPRTLGSHDTQNVLQQMTTQVNRDEGL